jgi:hypothetical protein
MKKDEKEVKRKGKSLVVDAADVEKEDVVTPDDRFPDAGKGEQEKEKKEKPFDSKFKKSIRKEERLKKFYDIQHKIKEKLGIKPKQNDEPSITAGIIFWLFRSLDFGLNATFIVLTVIAGVLGIFAIKDGVEPLKVIAICLFILTLSYVSDKIKG